MGSSCPAAPLQTAILEDASRKTSNVQASLGYVVPASLPASYLRAGSLRYGTRSVVQRLRGAPATTPRENRIDLPLQARHLRPSRLDA